MATANICDRCGTVYRAQTDVKKNRYHLFDSEVERNSYELHTWNGVRCGEILDLCDACNAELVVWVNAKHEV